ncbi:TauD/TfdA dioxygenase family protein [Aspergillus ibericus CBS 121593]|uniref:TfdA family taurine dioxygenase n=1 Tax=Aspergillus ibericus CBS 121593 TaxID=1448316 RepID=A0A395GKG6_9EURO|nr:tfdA family taurine dioxygenase [Aspergillus ibericus CBS 121593]RAK95985.1 tfdA family taurine dioxygenase [Aspergillus ibericus CBS 121593]
MPHPRIYSTGSLDPFNPILVTPVIGTEFSKNSCNIVDDILNAPNAEQRIRDLAPNAASSSSAPKITSQTSTKNPLILQMGHLTTRPADHGLHIHPVTNDAREFGDPDPEISTINSEGRKKLYKGSEYTRMAAVWHSAIAFEKAPADFSSLRLVTLPMTGGDTLWASGYEVYDRISKPYRGFLEGLTVTHVGEGFRRMAKSGGFSMFTGERGAPVNVGEELEAVHPVSSPLWFGCFKWDGGWKSIFPIGMCIPKINGLTRRESANMLQYFHDLITYGHDLQVRFKLTGVAIWDNRSVFHTATGDHEGFGPRSGNRAVGVGEVPYFDPESKSRREDLEIEDTLSPAHW